MKVRTEQSGRDRVAGELPVRVEQKLMAPTDHQRKFFGRSESAVYTVSREVESQLEQLMTRYGSPSRF